MKKAGNWKTTAEDRQGMKILGDITLTSYGYKHKLQLREHYQSSRLQCFWGCATVNCRERVYSLCLNYCKMRTRLKKYWIISCAT